MGDLIKRTADITANAAGNTVSPIVATLMTAAAMVSKRPDLAYLSIPGGALAGAATQHGMLAVGHMLNDRFDRVQQFADTVADEAGQTIEDFLANNLDDACKRDLLGHTVDAAVTARSAWKIKLLARAFVRGAKDASLVDETLLFVAMVADLDPAHARMLAAIAATPINNSIRDLAMVCEHDPGLKSAGALLVRDLTRLELIYNPGVVLHLTDLGYACADWLAQLGGPLEKA